MPPERRETCCGLGARESVVEDARDDGLSGLGEGMFALETLDMGAILGRKSGPGFSQ